MEWKYLISFDHWLSSPLLATHMLPALFVLRLVAKVSIKEARCGGQKRFNETILVIFAEKHAS